MPWPTNDKAASVSQLDLRLEYLTFTFVNFQTQSSPVALDTDGGDLEGPFPGQPCPAGLSGLKIHAAAADKPIRRITEDRSQLLNQRWR